MDLNKLFKIQAKLDDRIVKEHGLEGQDLLNKKILALQVELGELAQNWRGFKFWKVNPKPITKLEHMCPACGATGIITDEPEPEECCECDGTGKLGESNPLLEEYVDCLHFILSIGLELQIPDEWDIENISSIIGLSSIINLNNGILGNFNGIFQNVFAD